MDFALLVLFSSFAALIAIVVFFRRRHSAREEDLPREALSKFDAFFDAFLEHPQDVLMANNGGVLYVTEDERLRYFHFLLGAMDALAQTATNENVGQLWRTIEAGSHAAILFGPDEGPKQVLRYGRTGVDELHHAASRGWHSMRTVISSVNEKMSEPEAYAVARELLLAVKGPTSTVNEPATAFEVTAALSETSQVVRGPTLPGSPSVVGPDGVATDSKPSTPRWS